MANLIYMNEAAAIEWKASAGDEVLTLTSLAASAGRQGALHDFGVAARTRRYVWRLALEFATTPVVGQKVDIYLKTSDGTSPDNDDGTGDAAVSAEDKLRNLALIGSLIVDQAGTSVVMAASGVIDIDARYAAPVIWNDTADALSSTATDSFFTLTPVPDEIQ